MSDLTERRAPVQSENRGCKEGPKPYGTVSWAEHLEAWAAYHKRYPGQTAERMAQRGGFSYWEITEFLGREPTTWEPLT